MTQKIPQNFVPSSVVIVLEEMSSMKRTCLCAPTTHAGSFRCRLHRAPDKPSAKPLFIPQNTPNLKAQTATPSKSTSIGRIINRFRIPENSTRGVMPFGKPSSSYHRPRNLPKLSRLSKVTFACDVKEDEDVRIQLASFCIGQPNLPKPLTSAHSAASVRLLALKKCQGVMKEDILRMRVLETGTQRQPILSR